MLTMNMNLLTHRRSVWLGLLLAIILLLIQARPITNLWLRSAGLGFGSTGVTSDASYHALSPLILGRPSKKVIVPAPVKLTPAPVKATAAPVVQDLNHMPLKSFVRDYHIKFSGLLQCGDEPCPTQAEVRLWTDQNTDIHRTIGVASNGSFNELIPIREIERAQMDWRIVAISNSGHRFDSHGRHILTEDPVVEIAADFADH